LVDGEVLVNATFSSWNKYIFYKVDIENKEVIVELIDSGFYYEKDVYIDLISTKTGNHINKKKEELAKTYKKGLLEYLTNNLKEIYKLSFITFIILLGKSILNLYKNGTPFYLTGFIIEVIIFIVGSFLVSSLYYVLDWFSGNREVKEFDFL
jgi:hypothetical protein